MNDVKKVYREFLDEVDAFCADFGTVRGPISDSYFGKMAVGNSEFLARLRNGSGAQAHTLEAARAYMAARRAAKSKAADQL